MIIGNFNTTDDGYSGVIRTLAFTHRGGVRASPEAQRQVTSTSASPTATPRLVWLGKRPSEAGNAYLVRPARRADASSLRLMRAGQEPGIEHSFTLVWRCPRKRR